MALYHASPLHLEFLLLLVWILLAAGQCDNATKSIQFPIDARTGTKASLVHIPVHLSQNEGCSNQQSERLTEHSPHARLQSTSWENSKYAPPIQTNNTAFTCTAHCPMCPSCPPAPTCPSPCPALPQCPAPQACPTPCAACPTCPSCARHIPPGFEYFEGLGYYRLDVAPVDWFAAKATCERQGAYLAIINSWQEAGLMKNFFRRYPDIGERLFLGFHDLNKKGNFVTVFGQPLSSTGYAIWNPGQPDNHRNNEYCGSMYPTGGLNDLDCPGKYPFVCELSV